MNFTEKLPQFMDKLDNTWLIDTGSAKNYIIPSSVPDGSKICH